MTAIDTRTNATEKSAANDAVNGAQTAGEPTGATTVAVSPVELAGAVWGALNANPGASAATIATAAGVSQPTARRALNELEAAGHAARVLGGYRDGRRVPDAWNATPATDATGTPDTESEATTDTADDATGTDVPEVTVTASDDGTTPAPSAGVRPVDEATGDALTTDTDGEGGPGGEDTATDPVDAATPDTGTPPTEEAGPAQVNDDGDEGMDSAAVSDAREALTALGEAVTAALSALQAGDREAVLAAAETFYAGSGAARRRVRAAAHRRRRGASGAAHAAPGQLREKVAGHLAAHPGKEFTPHEISKVIGHSAGAIANALDRLAALGQAIETCERPRRFAATEDTPTSAIGAATGTATA
ncbi:DeoR family transcriptional regulator [Actinoallomurus rhizosphaericola]|uniref:DeoR family transcriptional regulator n=1 Tax=Actinoallomurus rhizosphaericola TaxID=2952536 RepID=UPI0020922FD3|nr:DeoR family transcriptional regulator [Actinoallomurus rhizosphaericola]MCO5999768.1 DeoR family transcriptional regulator [Actinoallomurus rhizosphaericola]